MKRSDKLRLIADLIDEGADFQIKSDITIPKHVITGLQDIDHCYIAEPIKINNEERFLLKRFVSKYKLIKRDQHGVIIVEDKDRKQKHLPNVFFELFNFMDEKESYVIQDLLNGKTCKIYR